MSEVTELTKEQLVEKVFDWVKVRNLDESEHVNGLKAELLRRLSPSDPPRPEELSEQLTHGMNCSGLIPGNENDCTCGLKWRIDLQTEQNLHAAWRKRAEEAEQKLGNTHKA